MKIFNSICRIIFSIIKKATQKFGFLQLVKIYIQKINAVIKILLAF